MSTFAPGVGFGDPDDPTAFVPFSVRRSRQGQYGDWEDGGRLGNIRQIAGSDDFDVYFGGFGPARLTLTLWFPDTAAYQRLRARYRAGTTGKLRLLAGFTSHGGAVRYDFDRTYELFPDTLIERLGDVVHEPSGRVECTAVFLRAEGTP